MADSPKSLSSGKDSGRFRNCEEQDGLVPIEEMLTGTARPTYHDTARIEKSRDIQQSHHLTVSGSGTFRNGFWLSWSRSVRNQFRGAEVELDVLRI